MKRTILISLLVIGAAATLVGAGSWAAFTASDSDSGAVTAGSIGISVTGTGASLAFDQGPGIACPSTMSPGDTCTDTVTVENIGTVWVSLDPAVGDGGAGALEDCGPAGDNLSTSASGYSGDGDLAPGESETFAASVTLDSAANNSCQGDSGTAAFTVDATSIPTP